jgi:hypothetical protein
MDIHHGPGNQRTIVRERGGVRVVSDHYGRGYIGRPYRYGGREFVARTYYYNGAVYSRFYQPYVWGGVPLSVYAPAAYFGVGFYGWAYNPWVSPVAWAGWGWAGNPWYAYYGAWYTPYPVYAGPAFWLTDYIVSQTLMAAYQAQAAELANQQAAGPPLTPDVKDLIANEVKLQLARENAEATAGAAQNPPDPAADSVGRLLSDNKQHIFVVSNGLSVAADGGNECFVTEGDVLQLRGSVPPGQPAMLSVLASKGQDCPKGSVVQVEVADLQEMQNHMRETLDQGMADLQKRQGQGGIPAAPLAAAGVPQQAAYAASAPAPDADVKNVLAAQTKEGEQAEAEVLGDPAVTGGPSAGGSPALAPAGGAPGGAPALVTAAAPPPKSLGLGMSVAEVEQVMGQPKSKADTGTKLIYVYDGLKVTFTGGKVTDIK